MTRSEEDTAEDAEVVVERLENTEEIRDSCAVGSSACFLRAIRVRDLRIMERLFG